MSIFDAEGNESDMLMGGTRIIKIKLRSMGYFKCSDLRYLKVVYIITMKLEFISFSVGLALR